MQHYLLMCMLCFSMLSLYSQQTNSSFVHFDTDKYSLDETSQAQLSNLLIDLEKYSDFNINIIGHTDEDGSDTYNETLSQKRAHTVSEYLISLGTSENKLTNLSKGESELLFVDGTHNSKKKNRRVELRYTVTNYESIEDLYANLKQKQPTQKTKVQPEESHLIDLEEGTTIYIPKNAFVHKDGTPVTSEVEIKVIEAFALTDFMAHDLFTDSKGDMLETGGMHYIEATADGSTVELGENKYLEFIYPVQKVQEGMEVFYGKTDTDGNMTWEAAKQPMKTTKVKSEPVIIDLEPILSYKMDGMERPSIQFEDMPKRPRLKKKPYPPSKAIYSNSEYEKLYARYEVNLEAFKNQRPKYEAAERKWQREVNIRSYAIGTYKKSLLEFDYKVKIMRTIRGMAKMEGRRASTELVQSLFGFLNKPSRIIIDERKILRNAYGNYTREIMDEKNIKIQPEGYMVSPKGICDDLRRLVFDAKQLAREARYSKTGRINQEGLSSYVGRVRKMGWINCDRFTRGDYDLSELTITDVEPGTKHYLIYKDIRSFMRPTTKKAEVTFKNTAIGQRVKLVAIKLVDEKPFMAVSDFKLEDDMQMSLNFKPSGLEDIKAELNSVDPTVTPSAPREVSTLSLNIFPNPTSDSFTAKTSSKKSLADLGIYNMWGALIKQINIGREGTDRPVSVSEFDNGTYVVRATYADGQSKSEQLIVQH